MALLGACLLLGLATTVAVAWVLAVGVVVSLPGGVGGTHGGRLVEGTHEGAGTTWLCQVIRRGGLTVVGWIPEQGSQSHVQYSVTPLPRSSITGGALASPRATIRIAPRFGMRGSVAPAPIDPSAIPRWAAPPVGLPEAPAPPRAGAMPWNYAAQSARGWPARALWYEARFLDGTRENRGGFATPRFATFLGPGPVLPCRVDPAGLALNTIFYAGLWVALLLVPRAIRHAIRDAARRRLGRCTACGYDLRASAGTRCPECGAAATARAGVS